MFGTNVKVNLGRSGNKSLSFYDAIALDGALNGGLTNAGLFPVWAFYHHWKDIRMTDADIQQSKMGFSLREVYSKESKRQRGLEAPPRGFNLENRTTYYRNLLKKIVDGEIPVTDLFPAFMTPVYYNTDGYPTIPKKADKTCCGILFRPFTDDEIVNMVTWIESCIESK